MQLVKRHRKDLKTFFSTQFEYILKSKDMTPNENGWLPLHHALKDNVSLGTIKLK